MHSPLHPGTALVSIELEPGLKVFRCPKSGGYWIPLKAYFVWKEKHGSETHPLPEGYEPKISDSPGQRTLLCPESGCIMARYRVGHGLTLQIDRSPLTGGVWVDDGEWDALKSRGLHQELHHIFTSPYQREVRNEETALRLHRHFQERIGTEDFDRAADFKTWMQDHPKRRDIIAFLLEGAH